MNKTNSDPMLSTIRDFRRFLYDISLLLSTATDRFNEFGWSTWNNQCLTEKGESVNKSEKWMPSYLFRFLKNTDHPNSLCFISVILDDTDHPYQFHTPLVTAGKIDYEHGCIIDSTYEYADSKAALWADREGLNAGMRLKVDVKMMQESDSKAQDIVVVACPLAEIGCTDDLEKKVVLPLMSII